MSKPSDFKIDLNAVLELRPHIVAKVWGGTFLSKVKGFSSSRPIGETWEVSNLLGGTSSYNEIQLNEFLNDQSLPYLIKFIETTDNLSIQVHPDDKYALKNENSTGKTECWVILKSDENAGIFLGLKAGVSKEQFEKGIKSGADLSKLLNFINVKEGDFFHVPAGTIHAIGKGVVLAEVQQSSGITYRVWDWNRLGLDGKPRELHVEKALDVINFDEKNQSFQTEKKIFSDKGKIDVFKFKVFEISLINIEPSGTYKFFARGKRVLSLIGLKGKINLVYNSEKIEVGPLRSFIIPEANGEIEVTSENGGTLLWVE